MARVLLVNPPFYRLWGSHYNGMMLGIASLCSVLRRAGHDCWMYNADYEPSGNYPGTREMYHRASRSNGWIPPIDNLAKAAAESIVSFCPNFVGYTTFSANYGMVLKLAEEVGRSNESIFQVAGGPHATVDLFAADRSPYLAARFSGESEETLLDFVEGRGVTKEGRRINDIGCLPLPDHTHWWSHAGQPMEDGEKHLVNSAYIATARGCPYACTFCSAPKLWGRRVTYFPVDRVINEFVQLQNSPHEIHVVDDTFTFNRERCKEILGEITARGLLRPWKCESRADSITGSLAVALKKAGCVHVKIGFESGSDRILRQVNKAESKDQMKDAVATLRSAGILLTGYFIAGYPGETDDDLRQTIDFARELDLDTYSLNIFAPYPGSEMHYRVHGSWDHLITDDPWKLFGQSRVEEINPDLSSELLEEYWSLSR